MNIKSEMQVEIMIRMKRTGRCSVYMTMDKDGLSQLIDALHEKREVEVEFDRRIINRKKTAFETRRLSFAVDDDFDGCGQICDTDGKLVWMLGSDDCEEAAYSFERCKNEGCFFPAEFLDIMQKNIQDHVYCEYVDEADTIK